MFFISVTKSVYIVLSRPRTIVSGLIYIATRQSFTHSGISLSPDIPLIYSFGRKYARFPLPGGFICEKMDSGILAKLKSVPGIIIKLDISDTQHERLTLLLNKMLRDRKKYKYNYSGFLGCLLGLGKRHEFRYTCSEFVAFALSECGITDFDSNLSFIKPTDLSSLPGKVIFDGDLKNYARSLSNPEFAST